MAGFVRLLTGILVGAAIAVAALAAAAYWLYRDAGAPGPLAEGRALVVPAHTGVAAIAGLLARHGVIRHPVTFEVMAALSGRGAALKPGEYNFPATTSVMQALDIIAEGRTVKHWLTIPEGLTSPEVVALVRRAAALAGDAGPVPPEGSLLPDTYAYSYGDSRKELLARMRHAMAHVVAELWRQRRPGLPLATAQQAVILASIVEKETAREEERAHIAGVYIDRLRRGMPLQADPTVLFALGDEGKNRLGRPLTHADLAVASPYNTYQVKGLPPGPIDNPSRSSLRAAMRPEPTEDLYFVADGSGGHLFARTLAGQSRNIAEHRTAPVADPETAKPAAAATGGASPAAGAAPHRVRTAVRERHCRHGSRHRCGGQR